MDDILKKIKRAIISGNYVFSKKAHIEMDLDGLTEMDAIESIMNAISIYKKIRSTSPYRKKDKDYLYIIISTNLDGLPIYTKGKMVKECGQEMFYFIISSKKAL